MYLLNLVAIRGNEASGGAPGQPESAVGRRRAAVLLAARRGTQRQADLCPRGTSLAGTANLSQKLLVHQILQARDQPQVPLPLHRAQPSTRPTHHASARLRSSQITHGNPRRTTRVDRP